MDKSVVAQVLIDRQKALLDSWLACQASESESWMTTVDEEERQDWAGRLLAAIGQAAHQVGLDDLDRPEWEPVRDLLSEWGDRQGRRGFSPRESAWLLASLKRPLLEELAEALEGKEEVLVGAVTRATDLLEELRLYLVESYLETREQVIARQQEEILELSTPVIELWRGILAVPLVGTLDSTRTQLVTENLLQRIVSTSSDVAIIDITGVPMIDTLVARNLLKAVSAANLMGAECIISGIRPEIAQTMVQLDLDFGDIVTKPNLAEALVTALERKGVVLSN